MHRIHVHVSFSAHLYLRGVGGFLDGLGVFFCGAIGIHATAHTRCWMLVAAYLLDGSQPNYYRSRFLMLEH